MIINEKQIADIYDNEYVRIKSRYTNNMSDYLCRISS